jgi:hypothetical protein
MMMIDNRRGEDDQARITVGSIKRMLSERSYRYRCCACGPDGSAHRPGETGVETLKLEDPIYPPYMGKGHRPGDSDSCPHKHNAPDAKELLPTSLENGDEREKSCIPE